MLQSDTVVLHSLEDTSKFAFKVAAELNEVLLNKSLIIGLVGDLGSGKTTFVKYLVEAFGGSNVSSPSYVLQNCYKTKRGINIEHWDLYRLAQAPAELFEKAPKATLKLIEWCDRDPELIKDTDVTITIIRGDNDTSRTIALTVSV